MPARATSLLVLLALAVVAMPAEAAKKRSPRLKAFSSCSNLIRYGNQHIDEARTPVSRGPAVRPMPMVQGDAVQGTPQPAAAPGAAERADDFSATNVQELGVDEPDTIKTDGDRLYTVARGTLYVLDARGTPNVIGTLKLSDASDHQLLLRGSRALVSWSQAPRPASASQAPASAPDMAYYRPETVLAEIDLRDPAAPRLVRTLTFDGYLLSGRLTGSTARMVISTPPQAVSQPTPTARPAATASAISRKRAAAWLPRGTFRSKRTGRKKTKALVACRAVRRTPVYSGMGMITVLSFDMDEGLVLTDSDSLMSEAQTMYASKTGLYVATQRWLPERDSATPPTTRTSIHKFDVSEAGKSTYRASGEVPGYLLSQWAMSERAGVLRVASTSLPTWWGTGPASESYVITLDEKAGRLVELGRVGGLGKGERIYAVRFIDDIGYVVTFRQTDPLYTVDVSDPAKPAVLGELKILGYSAYLHPVGKDLLLGVGQDATEEGQRLGAQLSLFDVSDVRAPKRLHAHSLGDYSSFSAEWDHHAFLYWEPSKTAILPVQVYGGEDKEPFTGAAAFSVDAASGIAERARIHHPAQHQWMGQISRSVVVGDRVFTLSELGVKASSLERFDDVAWVPFAAP